MSIVQFIQSTRRNRLYAWGAIVSSILILVIFKFIYPYPNLVMDSYFYTRAAAANADVNAWPIGYSKFIQLIGFFTHSPNVLVSFQYFFLEFTLLVFFFTVRFFFKLSTIPSNILFIFFFVNPLFIFTSNLIMADSLFNGLSILWITQLLWVIYRPRPYMIFTHALLLLITFSLRYNALYYPIISTLAFALSRQHLWQKLAGIGLPIVLLLGFITYTSNKMEAYCGVRQFSPFGGWKLANDVMYVYAHIHPDSTDTVPARFRTLDKLVRDYYDETNDPGDLMQSDVLHGSPFMFQHYSPLRQYMDLQYGKDTSYVDFKKWSKLGPFYMDYASYLIRKYPTAFARWFVWPNLTRYIFPPPEVYTAMTPFFLHRDDISPETIRWFELTTLTVSFDLIRLRQKIFKYYPVLLLVIHICFILGLLRFSWLRGWSDIGKPYNYILFTICCLWLCDLGFSVFAAAIVMRYQIFSILLEFSFALFFLEYMHFHPTRTSSKSLYLPFQKSYDHDSVERLSGTE